RNPQTLLNGGRRPSRGYPKESFVCSTRESAASASRRFPRERCRRDADSQYPIESYHRQLYPVQPSWSARRREMRQRSCFRSEEHTSELQSLTNLVCRLLLEKKKTKT